MSERGAPSPEALAACTAVLLTVHAAVGTRLEAFLLANGVACRTRRSTLTPEQLAEEALRQASPTAASLLESPMGRLFKGKLQRDLRAEIELHASGLAEQVDLLVRPEDVPDGLLGSGAAGTVPQAGDGSDPWARGAEPAVTGASGGSERAAPAAHGPAPVDGPAPVELCRLPWDQAWALVGRLAEAGIAAAVLEAEEASRDVPIADRLAPVGVRPEDLERARSLL
jgi:hypothetical protein